MTYLIRLSAIRKFDTFITGVKMCKKLNLKRDSLELAKASSFFAVMRITNPLLFRFCSLYGRNNLAYGYKILMLYYEKIILKVQDIYYSFKNCYSFCKWLVKNGIYLNNGSAQSINSIFSSKDRINLVFIKKLKLIIKAFGK